MLRVSGLAQTQMIKRPISGAQQCLNGRSTLQMRPMGAPGANDLVGPSGTPQDCGIIIGPDRIGGCAHIARIGGPPGKDIGDLKAAKPQRPGAALAALDRRVILSLSGGRGVQHHEQDPTAALVPGSGQLIAVALAIGIGGAGPRITLEEVAGNHAP